MEEDFEPVESTDEEFPVVSVWVNAGFGKGSYACNIPPDGLMTLPDGLVRELGIEPGDDLEWNLVEDEATIYIRVIRQTWSAPDWLDEDDEDDD